MKPCADSIVACVSRAVVIRYIASDEWRCVNNEMERTWKEPVVFQIQHNLSKEAEENQKPVKTSRYAGRDQIGWLPKVLRQCVVDYPARFILGCDTL